MNFKFQRVLLLGAHPDDEMGCGGFVSKLVEAGSELHHYYFSDCAISTIARGFPPEQLLAECEQSRDVLGVAKTGRGGFDFPVREFPKHRQDILESLVKLKREISPDLVLTANTYDFHQDHKTLTEEAIRAFKSTSILGYELPWNNFESSARLLVSLEPRHLQNKIRSIQCYASQRKSAYCNPGNVEAIARVRGMQGNSEYAEAYEAIRLFL